MTKVIPILVVTLLLISCITPLAFAQPAIPMTVYGYVLIDGEPAPAGLYVYAKVDTDIVASDTTDADGRYAISDLTTDIDLWVQDIYVTTVYFESGAILEQNLTVIVPVLNAEFSAMPLSGDEPLTVAFTDESTYVVAIDSWLWDFGDGETSTEQNPTHTYVQDGVYTVSLTVTEGAESDTETKPGYITVLDTEPVADFSGTPTIGPPPLPVSFTDLSESYDGIVSWSWDFGDEATSTEPNPTHAYEAEGTYTVALTVAEDDGDTDTEEKLDYITVTALPPPTADFIANVTSGSEPLTVAFTDLSEYFDGIISWEWDFDNNGVIDSTEQNPTYTYEQDGLYTVSLNVTGVIDTTEARASATKADYITVLDTEPTADFKAKPTTGAAPLNVSFTDLSESYDGIVSWSWDFGDGGISAEPNPTHVYEAVGNYTVTLTVSEDDDDTDTEEKADYIIVTALPPDVEPPVIVYAEIIYPIGAESARPGESVLIFVIVTDNVGVTYVEVSGYPFGTVPMESPPDMPADMYVPEVPDMHVPEDTPRGNYTLTILALDAADNEASTTVTLVVAYAYTAYNVWLTDGWNLISLPLIPDNSSSGAVMAGVSIWAEDLIRVYAELHPELGWDVDAWMPTVEAVWAYDATTKTWLFYEPATGVGDLTKMRDGWGYWLKVSVPEELEEEGPPAILTVHGVEFTPGPVTPPEYHVVPGWNLIGYKSTHSIAAGEYLRSIEGKYAKVYGYSAWAQCFYWVRDEDDMHPGYGYWIYVTEEGFIAP